MTITIRNVPPEIYERIKIQTKNHCRSIHREIWSILEQAISVPPTDVKARLVLTLASQSSSSAYDGEFVALPREVGCKLITANKQIVRNFPAIAILLEEFVN